MVMEGLPPTSAEMAPELPPGPFLPVPAIAYQDITVDTLVSIGPVLFWGLIMTAAVAVNATIYNGVNATGRRIATVGIGGAGSPSGQLILVRPIELYDGLFISLSAAVADCLVLFEPLPTS